MKPNFFRPRRGVSHLTREGWREEAPLDPLPPSLREAPFYSILPPLWDHHGHLPMLGNFLEKVDLRGTKSIQEFQARLTSARLVEERNRWITGFGWDDRSFNGSIPHRKYLDEMFPDTPVFLSRLDCHAALVNTRALEISGLDETYPDPGGGILTREDGLLTGLLVDNAMEAVVSKIPIPGRQEIERQILKAIQELKNLGLSGTTSMDLSPMETEVLQKLEKSGRLLFPVEGYLKQGAGISFNSNITVGGNFKIRGVKFYADGALGSRGAALHEDYSDMPGKKGLLLWKIDELASAVAEVARKGFQPAIHAIGDRGLSLALDSLEKSGFADIGRIEHVQIASEKQLERMAELGVTACLQPCHLIDDYPWAELRLGNRMKDSYRLASIIKRNIPVLLSTDYPISDPSPRLNFRASLYREDKGENISLQTMLESYAPPSDFRSALRYTIAALEVPPWGDGALGASETTFHVGVFDETEN